MHDIPTDGLFPDQPAYFGDLYRRNGYIWIGSGLAAAGLNLGLFLLMVYLIEPTPVRTSIERVVPRVHLAHVVRPEKKVEPKSVTPITPIEKKRIERLPVPENRPVKVNSEMALFFEIDPQLPAAPAPLNFSIAETAALVQTPSDIPDTFTEEQLDAPLAVLNRISPVYPKRAKRRGIEGRVRVKFMVDESGSARSVTVVESHPEGLFDENVTGCVKKWRFRPGTVGGFPVKTRVETTIKFEMEQ